MLNLKMITDFAPFSVIREFKALKFFLNHFYYLNFFVTQFFIKYLETKNAESPANIKANYIMHVEAINPPIYDFKIFEYV